jgi:hypothetical protein
MPRPTIHARIPDFPYAASLQGVRLDALSVEGRDLLFDYQEFVPRAAPTLFIRDGVVWERRQGEFVPRRLRFKGVTDLQLSGVYEDLNQAPQDHPARELHDMLRWVERGHTSTFYILFNNSAGPDDLRFFARSVTQEARDGQPVPVSFERDWSPPPPTRTGLIPQTPKLYERFGGDPITVHLNGRAQQRRLFIGGLHVQPARRPQVDAVLNLGENPSRWKGNLSMPACDRWVYKGEGAHGMRLDEVRHEALWVIERLRKGERVLVHCVAGMNRSATICCAVLILLEGIPAEDALARVREHHPWARPDSHHWLSLRWLAKTELGK